MGRMIDSIESVEVIISFSQPFKRKSHTLPSPPPLTTLSSSTQRRGPRQGFTNNGSVKFLSFSGDVAPVLFVS